MAGRAAVGQGRSFDAVMVHAYLSARIPAWRRLARAGVDLLFPDLCPWCRRPLQPGDDFLACSSCVTTIKRIEAPYCVRCGVPLDAGVMPVVCRRCLAEPPHFDRLRGVLVYQGPVAESIKQLKYHRRLAQGFALARVLYQAVDLGVRWPRYDAILPVPLFPARFRDRRFNQSALLITEMPGSHRLPIRSNWLQRVRDTAAQASLSAAERSANVKNAFALEAGVEVAGRRLLLVDDVATTGATLNECARVCKKAGAAAVDAVVLARAPL